MTCDNCMATKSVPTSKRFHVLASHFCSHKCMRSWRETNQHLLATAAEPESVRLTRIDTGGGRAY